MNLSEKKNWYDLIACHPKNPIKFAVTCNIRWWTTTTYYILHKKNEHENEDCITTSHEYNFYGIKITFQM